MIWTILQVWLIAGLLTTGLTILIDLKAVEKGKALPLSYPVWTAVLAGIITTVLWPYALVMSWQDWRRIQND